MARSRDPNPPDVTDLVTSSTEGDLTFTVDSRLLEELGARLVGKPSMALAELVKNAYDADATKAMVPNMRAQAILTLVDAWRTKERKSWFRAQNPRMQ